MKWAKPKLLRDVRSAEQKAYDEKCYRFYSKDEMKAMFGSRNSWVHHPFRFKFNSEEEYLKFQHRYEMFVGGYLFFYDEKTRNGAIDSVLHFKWSPFQKSTSAYSVVIYLWPAPLRAKGKGGKPVLSKSSRMVLASTEVGSKKTNGLQVMGRTTAAKTMGTLDEEESGDLAIDPPPPPPPPPPPFQ